MGSVRAGDIQRDINVGLRIEGGQQVEFLEDESDLALAQPGALGVGELRKVVAVNDDVAGVGASQSAQQVEKRGFAAARRADDADKFSLLHAKGDTPEGGNINFAHAVGLAQFDGFDEGRHPTDRYYTKPAMRGIGGIRRECAQLRDNPRASASS